MRAWLMAGMVTMVGCSGPGTDTHTDAHTDNGTTETGTTTTGPVYADVWDGVLKGSCALAGCHAIGSANGMEVSESGGRDAMVNQPSIVVASETLVIPGDPDNSYVIKKLEGTAGIVGTEMPPPFGGQDPADIQLIRDWIAAGAP